MHAISQDDFVGQCEPPWFHRVLGTKMHFLDFRIAMVRHRVAFRSLDALVENRILRLLIDGKCGRRSRLGVFLNDRASSHGDGGGGSTSKTAGILSGTVLIMSPIPVSNMLDSGIWMDSLFSLPP